VDEVRELIRRVSVKPFEGGRHTVVIDDAEKADAPGAERAAQDARNAAGRRGVFLLTSSPARMLPTIVSRCRQARFHPVSAAQAEQALIAGGAPQVRARLAAVASGGCIGRAWEQLQDEGYWAARDRVIQSLKALKGPSSVAEAAARLAQDRDGTQQTLEILESLARDVIRAECAPAPGQRELNPEDLAVDGEALLMGVLSARQKLNANVSWQTVLEMMYFDSLRGSIPWQQ
jgi:DNA polymerase-3 subunit delta'